MTTSLSIRLDNRNWDTAVGRSFLQPRRRWSGARAVVPELPNTVALKRLTLFLGIYIRVYTSTGRVYADAVEKVSSIRDIMGPLRPTGGGRCLGGPDGSGGGVHCSDGFAALHRLPIRFLSIIALISGIASHVVTSDLSSQSPHQPPSAHFPPSVPHASTRSTTEAPLTQLNLYRQDQRRTQQYDAYDASPASELRQPAVITAPQTANESEAAEGRRPPPVLSESILDMIDTEEVDRFLAKKEEERLSEAVGPETRTTGRRIAEDGGVMGREGSGPRDNSGESEGMRMRKIHSDARRNKKPTGNKKRGPKDRQRKHRRVSLSRLSKWMDVSPLSSYPSPNSPIPLSPEPFPPPRDTSRDKILRSSKDALVVTRREYLRKDWCRTEPLVQRVKIAGCLTRSLINGFCYGQCNSFYIPRNPSEFPLSNNNLTDESGHSLVRSDPTNLSSTPILYTQAFKSCAFCKPQEVTWVMINLRCPAFKPAQLTLRRRVERIKQCKCISEVVN